jgi:hypothetical protein
MARSPYISIHKEGLFPNKDIIWVILEAVPFYHFCGHLFYTLL